MRALVVGCGSIGKRHARLLAERPDIEVWVCDTLEANLRAAVAQAPEARPVADFAAALAERPDLVFVCTPNHLHRPMCEAAIEVGCHVLCEKPLADTLANAEAIAHRVALSAPCYPERSAERTAKGLGPSSRPAAAPQDDEDGAGSQPTAAPEDGNPLLFVGYSLRCHGGLRRVLEIVRSGVLGTLVGGRAMVGTYFTLMCATTPYRMTEPNALITDYTHLLDYMRLLLGDAARVSAEAATLGDLPLCPSPNLFSLLVRYRSGAVAQIHMDYIQHPQRSTVELYGDRGTVTYDFQTGKLQLFERAREDARAQADMRGHAHHVEHVLVGRDDIYRAQIETLLSAVRGEQTPLATAQDGVAALKLADAAVQAAATGRAVPLN